MSVLPARVAKRLRRQIADPVFVSSSLTALSKLKAAADKRGSERSRTRQQQESDQERAYY